MSSLDGHRILIATLFLPNTVNLSPHATPILTPVSHGASDALNKAAPVSVKKPAVAPLRSIVEDLTVKSKGITPTVTPDLEAPNPFAPPPYSLAPPLIAPISHIATIKNAARVSSPSRVPGSIGNVFSDSPLLSAGFHSDTPHVTHPSLRGSHGYGSDGAILQMPPPAVASPATPLVRRSSRTSNSRSASLRRSNSALSNNDGRNSAIAPWAIQNSVHGNVGLHKAVASVEHELDSKLWIGVLDLPTDDFSEEMRRDVHTKLGQNENFPVWVKDEDFVGCYDVFCHQVLWPSLHYAVPDAPKTKVFYESSSFEQYKTVNQKFANAIVSVYREGDIVWVNDYHLCLVPQLVRQKLPNATIGFFMHVAWPSSEIFRCLAVRKQLLYGLLGADLIGFQTHNFARHFRQTCSRILSLETLPKGIQLENSFVDVAVFPMGIDVADLTVKRSNPEVEEWANSLKQRYEGRKLIVGRDKLDGVHGVRHKIIAFEEFLEKYPEFQGKAVLIQVALATTEQNELQAYITDVVSRVNSRFGSLTYLPVVLLHTTDITFPIDESTRGMALRTHEYVECQEKTKRPLILSEFTGSYSYSGFRQCIAINPWDYKNTADAIFQALTMNDEEATSRWQDLHSHVITQTAQAFVTSFLTRCVRVHAEHLQRSATSIPPLSISTLQPRYVAAKKRLILLDFESTLWTEDPRITYHQGEVGNQVWVLSGLPVLGGLEKLASAVPGLGLVAENGCFIKEPQADEWVSMVSKLNFSWRPLCVEILGYFTERTPGSFVEERGASVVWRFPGWRDGPEKQWALRQAAEAQNHIWDSLGERFGLRIIPGTTSFLVLPKNVSRSTAVGVILRHEGAPTSLASASAADPHIPVPHPLRNPRAIHVARSTPGQSVTSTTPPTAGEFQIILTLSGDEHLIRRLNRLEGSETCSTSGKGSDAKWRLESSDALASLKHFVSHSSACQ
ncbi:glycosyltransferase family 20 protein [Hydnum rufescens UP504]|uniref:Glycosyltransferase family 20 protein n=1 Tax=Hydnum rufescens UP504 TaxID=1448309 RepID=A0A9P6B3I6_9AGAM|nr:glycosyltransferase family 20 protein [Hydnum rufescens UP504]